MTAPQERQPDQLPPLPPERHKRLGFRALALLPLGVATLLLVLLFLREESPLTRRTAAPSSNSAGPQGQDTAPVLLLRACQALEENRLDEAQEVISLLRPLAPERPEPRLLEKLLAHRRKLFAPGWGQAFLDAWAELGRPDLRASPLLPPARESNAEASALTTQVWPRASAETRLILVMATPALSEEQARWLLQHIPSLDDTAPLVALLDPRRPSLFPTALRSQIQAALLQRLQRLSQDSSRAMLPRLALFLSVSRSEAPFNAPDLGTLEVISTLPIWRETSFSQTFLQARGHLQESGLPDAATRAFGVAEQTVGPGVALLLRKRAEASWSHLSVDEQRWLGRMLWNIGQRMADASSLLEHSVGTLLMELGAEHLGQMCDLSQVLERDEAIREGLRISLQASIERWPLPSLLEDLESSRARNEQLWLRAFTGHAHLP